MEGGRGITSLGWVPLSLGWPHPQKDRGVCCWDMLCFSEETKLLIRDVNKDPGGFKLKLLPPHMTVGSTGWGWGLTLLTCIWSEDLPRVLPPHQAKVAHRYHIQISLTLLRSFNLPGTTAS